MAIQFPLNIRFKLMAFAPRMFVTDVNGDDVCYVSQKVMRLKEDIQVFTDDTRSKEIYRIKADRIMDFSATYHFSESESRRTFGAVKSKGWRSIWRATYEVLDANENETHRIQEVNPWVKVGDALVSQIPFVNMFTGYFLHPKYAAYNSKTEQPVMQLNKEAGFFEGRYSVEKLDANLTTDEERRILLSFMLMVQFMRRRG
ncbi:MAG TPA: hypothetical protein PLD47_04170 [Aggregatilineales bacterium]|nr:hypothetical protein [Anaerolineales bacterium]HRE46897.1 hypothetical protein [Aggregatilineales bacterium]